jgi:serine/threonine protein kinase
VSEAAKQAEELQTLIGTTLAERYRIDALLGSGGMGAVFRARHLLLKRDVAVKVLHPELVANEDISKRFDREAQSAARLDHPNVIPVTEFGSTSAGMKYMVMQLLAGRELSELLTQPLDPLRAIELEIQILRGLEHAHGKGVIHRDLKPENVFVTVNHEGEEVLKLVDFGIAKIIDEDTEDEDEGSKPLTRMGLVFGTPHYMSPEQATGSAIDQRTDIYSAGVMLYQMLAGRLPFVHDDPVSLIRMQVTVDPPPLPETIPPRLRRVVSLMMAKSRDQRYPDARSARKALQAIQAALAGEAGVPIPLASEDTGVVDPADFEDYDMATPLPAESYRGLVTPAPHDLVIGDSSSTSQSGPRTSASGSGPTMMPVPVPGAGRSMTLADTLTKSHPIPGGSVFAAVPRKWWYVSGGVLGLLLLIALWPHDEGSASDEASDQPGLFVGKLDEAPEPSLGEIVTPGIDEAALIAIDQALTSKNEDTALDLIRPARDKFPNDPQLLWREGKALSMKRAKSSKVTALERYAQALDSNPKLIDDPDFYGELYVLLRNSTLQEQAINLAVQKLGSAGHKFLLELVNVDDPKMMLGWVDRHRVLTELGSNADASKLVDWRLNRARDLYQAADAPAPCAAFRDTLDAIAESKDVYYVEHIFNAKLSPPVPTSDKGDAAICAGLDDKLVVVRDLLTAAHPQEAAKFDPDSGKSSRKKKKRR